MSEITGLSGGLLEQCVSYLMNKSNWKTEWKEGEDVLPLLVKVIYSLLVYITPENYEYFHTEVHKIMKKATNLQCPRLQALADLMMSLLEIHHLTANVSSEIGRQGKDRKFFASKEFLGHYQTFSLGLVSAQVIHLMAKRSNIQNHELYQFLEAQMTRLKKNDVTGKTEFEQNLGLEVINLVINHQLRSQMEKIKMNERRYLKMALLYLAMVYHQSLHGRTDNLSYKQLETAESLLKKLRTRFDHSNVEVEPAWRCERLALALWQHRFQGLGQTEPLVEAILQQHSGESGASAEHYSALRKRHPDKQEQKMTRWTVAMLNMNKILVFLEHNMDVYIKVTSENESDERSEQASAQ